FPFGSQLVTGVFLEFDHHRPDGSIEHFERTLADRIGYATRQGNGGVVSIDPDSAPIFSSWDTFTANFGPGLHNANVIAAVERELLDLLVVAESLDPNSPTYLTQATPVLRDLSTLT